MGALWCREGRKLWAKVITKTRCLARCATVYVDGNEANDSSGRFFRWLVSFPVALKQHLRGERAVSEFRALSEQERSIIASTDNMPLAVCMALSEMINRVKSDESQSSAALLWWQMDSMVCELEEAVAHGEAIAGTPVPLSYSQHTSRLLSLWTICMPFLLVTALPPWLVPPATILVSWMLLATEEIGHIIEEPFGLHDDRPQILPLEKYCDVVGRDLEQISRGAIWELLDDKNGEDMPYAYAAPNCDEQQAPGLPKPPRSTE